MSLFPDRLGLGSAVLISMALPPGLYFAEAGDLIPTEVIVKLRSERGGEILHSTPQLKSETSAQKANRLAQAASAELGFPVRAESNLASGPLFFKLTLPTSAGDLRLLTEGLKKQHEVAYVEPNYVYHHAQNPPSLPPSKSVGFVRADDPLLELAWGIRNQGSADRSGRWGIPGTDSGAAAAWPLQKGSDRIIVAVIDSGIDLQHPDLKNNIFKNVREVPNNGKDDDRNGYVDDFQGWNFVDGTSFTQDDNGHGTHVAGIIGAEGGNRLGTVGVNWSIRLLPIKAMNRNGDLTTYDIVQAIQYAIQMGAQILNLSWVGINESRALWDSLLEARKKGILVVTAAGNAAQDNDSNPVYPAAYPLDHILSVASVHNRGGLAESSNFGQTTVHLAAPGENILSTYPTQMPPRLRGDVVGYTTMSGTSMAAPFVSGSAALLWAQFPRWSFKKIRERLLDTVDADRFLRKRTVAGGRVNALSALLHRRKKDTQYSDRDWVIVPWKNRSKTPYPPEQSLHFQIYEPRARALRIHLMQFDIEPPDAWTGIRDLLWIEDSAGKRIDQFTGAGSDVYTEVAEGSSVKIHFFSDISGSGRGWVIDRYEFIPKH